MSNTPNIPSEIKKTCTICAPKQESLSKKVFQGGMWTFLLRFINNVLSFIRKVILARLLFPEDFGLMGIAMIAIATLETFSRTGIQAALIQRREEIESYLDTVWTFYCIRGILVFFILYISAPLIAGFFQSSQAIPIIRVVGILPLIAGFKNIGILCFQKELEFNKLFMYEFSATIANLAVSISLAFILHSAWALVWGGVSAAVVRLVLSFAIHPYRPKVRLKKDKLCELLGFGKWVSISGTLIFFINQGDDIFVGKMLGVATLGIYQMAFFISSMPTTEITNVIALVTYPAYSKMQHDFKRIRSSYSKVLQVTMALSMPLAGGVFILAADFTKLFMGDKWLPILPAIQILVLAGLIRSIAGTTVLYECPENYESRFFSVLPSYRFPGGRLRRDGIRHLDLKDCVCFNQYVAVRITGFDRVTMLFTYVKFIRQVFEVSDHGPINGKVVLWLTSRSVRH